MKLTKATTDLICELEQIIGSQGGKGRMPDIL